MSFLQEIQESITQENSNIGPILLKLRLLASRLGSPKLEEWVKYESEGYPLEFPLPDYRKIPISYSGTFLSYSKTIKNAPIPLSIIKKFVGENRARYELRNSIAAIDELIARSAQGSGSLYLPAADLILLLQGNVYEDYDCNEVRGEVSRASLVEIQHSVRSRILELTIELEKSIPEAAAVSFGNTQPPSIKTSEKVTQISSQVVYGNVTSITSSGDHANIALSFNSRDGESFKQHLIKSGINESDAAALTQIVSNEASGNKDEPLGQKAKVWLADNIKKAADGTWKVGISVAAEVIKKAVLRYYGLDQ